MARSRVSKRLLGASWAAGLVVGAIGALALKPRPASESPSPDAEFAAGRGAPAGPVDPAAKDAGYELGDANVRSLVIIMLVSVVLIAGGVAGVFAMFGAFDRHFQSASDGLTAEQRAVIPPPLPHLQIDPYRDLDTLRTEQERQLTTYGFAAPHDAQPHIPIERAMQQVVGKPLDAAGQAGVEHDGASR